MKSQKQYYHLIAGNVVYKVPTDADTNEMNVIILNGILTTDTQVLGINELNNAQQVLQHHFRDKTEDPTIEIVDVIILNIAYLGLQSKDEFHNLNLEPKE
jgi:hypothetical protein